MLQFPRIDYDSADTTLYKTNGYSGTDSDLDNTAPVDQTDGYTKIIDATSNKGIKLDFKFNASGSTDDLVVKLYVSSTGVFTGTEIAIDERTISSDGNEDVWSYTLMTSMYGPGYYRFSMQSSGGNDTFDIQVTGRFWRGVIEEE